MLENFAHTLEECIDRTPVRHVVLAAMGDLLGFWRGRLVNFAVRHVRRMVPEFKLPLDGGRTVTPFSDALTDGMRLSLRRVDVGPDDVAFLQYTGGTTGVSKGATLLHRNVVANIMQWEAWVKPMLDRVGDQLQGGQLSAHTATADRVPPIEGDQLGAQLSGTGGGVVGAPLGAGLQRCATDGT